MLWMILLAFLAAVLVLFVATLRGLEVDRSAAARFLLASFFLMLSFIGLGVASFLSAPEMPVLLGQPLFAPPQGKSELAQALGILAAICGGAGLFFLVFACVRLAQSQPRQEEYDGDGENYGSANDDRGAI